MRLRILVAVLISVLLWLGWVAVFEAASDVATSVLPKTWKPGKNPIYDDMLSEIQRANVDYARYLPRGEVVGLFPPGEISAMYRLHEGSDCSESFGERPRPATAADYRQPYVLYNPAYFGYIPPAERSRTKTGPEAPFGLSPPPPRDRVVTLVFHDGRFHVVEWHLTRDNGKPIPEDKQVKHYLP